MHSFLLVGAGGALGAMARYGVSGIVARIWPSPLPWATLVVNVAGSVAMGLLVGALARLLPPAGEGIRLFVAVGVLGGFTTFSAFSLDVVTLIERAQWSAAAAYVAASVAFCIVGLGLGLLLARAVL